MTVADVISEIEAAGVAFRLDGEKVRVWYPDEAQRQEFVEQIAFLRNQRASVMAFLKARSTVPKMPPGVCPRCPTCSERMVSIPHSELVDEHFGCAGCGKVYYECDDRLWPCKFPGQDVPGWRLKHELPRETQIEPTSLPKSHRKDFSTPTGSGDAR